MVCAKIKDMELEFEFNLNRLEEIIVKHAKYQKVMVIYDDSVNTELLMDIREKIKSSCVYNEISVHDHNINEVYNGYKLIIYLCSANGLINLDFEKDEFVNVFVSIDGKFLPVFINSNSELVNFCGYIFIDRKEVDKKLLASYYFNCFYNYLFNIYNDNIDELNIQLDLSEINLIKMVNLIKSLPENFIFKDMEILKYCKLDYDKLLLVDLILIDAFLVLINKIKNNQLMLIDAYKIARTDISIIDKIYAMANNKSFIDMVYLNYNSIFSICNKCKNKIVEILKRETLQKYDIEKLINHVKNYTKNDNNLMFYLFLYDIFEN